MHYGRRLPFTIMLHFSGRIMTEPYELKYPYLLIDKIIKTINFTIIFNKILNILHKWVHTFIHCPFMGMHYLINGQGGSKIF